MKMMSLFRSVPVWAATALVLLCCGACQCDEKTAPLTDALNADAWQVSEWISAADAPVVTEKTRSWTGGAVRAADGASWFVADIANDKKVVSARWMTAGLGVYSLYLNGQPVGQEEFLKPGFTHAKKTKRSFTYDVSDLLKKGSGASNQWAAQVTPGWWADRIVTPGGHQGMVGRKCAFRCVLELCYEDGSTRLFGTDSLSWKAGIAGPVLHAGIFDGEEYDARIAPGYLTPELLSTPEINREFQGEILPTNGAEIYLREDLTLQPVQAYTWKDTLERSEEAYGKVKVIKEFAAGETLTVNAGEQLVVDFGQNAAAVPAFCFKAAEGTHLVVLPGEILNDGCGAKSRGMDGPEGSVHRTNLRIGDKCVRLEYTFGKQKGWVCYHPQCTFFGYRYIAVTTNGPVQIRSVRSIPVTSITKAMETGRLETGNGDINRLISNTVWGQRSNYLSVPTDCPQRNERLGWMADTQVFAETGTFFANTDAFFHKWMRDVRDSQNEKGSYPGVCPPGIGGASFNRFGWADAGVIVPWVIWKQFGDTAIVDECWASMERFMDDLNQTRNEHKYIKDLCGNYQYADWLSYEPLESSARLAFSPDKTGKKTIPLPEAVEYWNYLGGCYWLMDAEMMRDMAAATGRDAVKYEQMAARARAYLRETFFTREGLFKNSVLNTMQTPALFAMRCKLVEGAALNEMKARLRANFEAHGGCLQTGFLGTSILMSTLTENGMADVAWDLLFQRKNPSWLYSVDNGATTIWERWNSYTREFGMGPKGMNSFNHYAYGCVCEWIWETAAGISCPVPEKVSSEENAVGFKHIVLKPIPDKRLGWIEAEYHSAAGLIKSAWRYEGDQWIWDFTIPEGAVASVFLPGESESRLFESGSYTETIVFAKLND